jgi:hypothetical protein
MNANGQQIAEVSVDGQPVDSITVDGSTVWQRQTQPESGVARWTFEGSGSTATDAWGDNDGSISGGSRIEAGGSQALTFDADGYVLIPELTVFDGSFTLAGWISISDLTHDGALATGDKSEQGGQMPWALWYDKSDNHRFRAFDGSNSVYSETQPAEGAWYHVVWTHDGTASALYVDGTKEGSGTMDPAASGAQDILASGQAPVDSKALPGRIDDVRVYSRALSADEVGALYSGGSINA